MVACDRRPGTSPADGAWHQTDLEDATALADLWKGCQAVIHLAGVVPGRDVTPSLYRAGNVWVTAVVAEAASRAGVGRLVLSSTSHVYGLPPVEYVAESQPLAPESAYAESKVAAEEVASALARVGGVAVVSARLGNLYGFLPADDTVVGRLVGQVRHVQPMQVRSAADVRDFTHVDDAASALVRLAGLPAPVGTLAVNVSTGVGWSVAEVAERLARVAGLVGAAAALRVETPAAPATRLVMDVSRLNGLVGPLTMQTIDDGMAAMFHARSGE